MTRLNLLQDLARLPAPGDNCAIATRRIESGTRIQSDLVSFSTDRAIVEGHRFAVAVIQPGDALLSWGLPFGIARYAIMPGAYVCNRATLEELRLHDLDIELPDEPNFEDLELSPFQLDEATFRPAGPVEPAVVCGDFEGYRRPGSRGVGTRNCIVVLGTSSRTAAYARLLAERTDSQVLPLAHVDRVAAVAHTEGGGDHSPNNLSLLLRTLAGFIVHPNVGAILAADQGVEPVTNRLLGDFMQRHDYPLEHVRHQFLTLRGHLEDNLAEGERIIRDWLQPVTQERRTTASLAHLKIALQCGGSDAFSGVSANPLSGWVAREIIRQGGSANLAETDELIGAESYLLARVGCLETCRKFLQKVERYKQLVAWHGLTAEGNPSGGNRLRGLYNITLKSIGAAMKRHPGVRLDRVIDYSAPMDAPGFYFMDSPGNDLESVAGQVASGANLIFFTTGNGSVTNFPFVPTLKVMTTTRRYELLAQEMDVNAGLYLDGIPMDSLGQNMHQLALATASGHLTKGEEAGHYQVSIWRDWRQTDFSHTQTLQSASLPPGTPLRIEVRSPGPEPTFKALAGPGFSATEQVNLILPTSLCSGQVALLATQRLNHAGVGTDLGVTRTVTLVHTEGCGSSGASSDTFYRQTMLGYLTHPNVARALLLEHGCEKMHNARLRQELKQRGIDDRCYGFASVQLDGGIEKVLDRIESWFSTAFDMGRSPGEQELGIGSLRLGLFSTGRLSAAAGVAILEVTRRLVGWGAGVVVPENASLLRSRPFTAGLLGKRSFKASLGYGAAVSGSGFFVMESPSAHAVEALTGLGATGVHLILCVVTGHPVPAHPLVHTLQCGAGPHKDIDVPLMEPSADWPQRMLEAIIATASRQYVPKLCARGYTDFQLSRGLLGVSM